ncbi:MAG: hypothetical protein M3115_07475 [Thermoproteota archaeon]|nr:hypothetical protein [Thermoproteota archaeon]
MPAKDDEIQEEIYNLVKTANEPLETEEVIRHIHSNVEKDASRNKVMYRLNNLRAEGKISGKMLGSGKGVWVWWHRQESQRERPRTELGERDMPKREFSNLEL